jgi:dolichyl-diphosphooligosaccharide---protein glycosyltransferase
VVGDGIRERLVDGLGFFGKLRIQISHSAIIAFAALLLILFIAFTIRILPLRWEELSTGQILLNEFDPYFQFSLTRHMVENGLLSPYWPTAWINPMHWYPAGLDMARSLPALPMTAAVLYNFITLLGVNINLMTFTAILPAFMGAFACLIIYFAGKDMGGRSVGLFSALFLALAPSFLQRSSLGFFDTELPGVIGLVLFMFMFLRAIDNKRTAKFSLLYSLGAGGALAYFITGWGAAYYLIALAVLFVFVLIILKRYSQRLLLSYSITFGTALFIATKAPYISLDYLMSGPVIPVAGVFVLLVVAEILRHNISVRSRFILTISSIAGILGAFIALWATGSLTEIAGKFASVLDPFARSAAPLIESVAEHRISGWGNLYLELGIGIVFFLVGLYFTVRNPTNRNLFLLLFSATALYFASSMVRLLVIFAPVFAILMAKGIMGVIGPFYTLLKETPHSMAKAKRKLPRVSKEYSGLAIFLIFIILATNFSFAPQTGGMPRVFGQAYSPTAIRSSSLPIAPPEPVGEWLNALMWTNQNLDPTDVVVAWWDYGYWLSVLGNVTTLADNGTVNSTQIENIGFIFMGNENQSMEMLKTYDPERTKYIAVFTVLYSGRAGEDQPFIVYSAADLGIPGGDEGKWFWMARISGSASQRFIDQGLVTAQTTWTDETSFGAVSPQTNQWQWNEKGLNSTIYLLMNWAKQRYAETMTDFGIPVQPDVESTQPIYFKEIHFEGLETSPFQYGGLVPVIAIYEIDWVAYNNAIAAAG